MLRRGGTRYVFYCGDGVVLWNSMGETGHWLWNASVRQVARALESVNKIRQAA